MRAVAVALVFAHHAAPAAVPGGWLGVELFFALSGFLISSLLLDEWSRTGRIRLGAFYIRRALRLMPGLVAFVGVMLPVALFARSGRPLPDAAATLLYVTNVYSVLGRGTSGLWAHTWSLSVEEQFYLLWPLVLVAALARAWRLPWVVTIVAAGGFVLGAAVAVAASSGAAYRLPFAHIPVLLAGVGLAVAVHRRSFWLRRFRSPVAVVAGGLGLCVASPLLEQEELWLYLGGLAVAGLGLTAGIAHLVVAPAGVCGRVLSIWVLRWLGDRSYGFYLWHYPVLLIALHVLGNRWTAVGVGLAVTLAVTQLSWLVVEKPFLRLKNGFATAARVGRR